MEIPFVGGAYQDRSLVVNAQECINFYPVVDKEGGKVSALYPTPGIASVAELTGDPTGGVPSIRGMIKCNFVVDAFTRRSTVEHLFIVYGDGFAARSAVGQYSSQQPGVYNVFATYDGPVSLATNGDYVLVADGAGLYYYTANVGTVTSVSAPPAFDFVSYQDGYFIANNTTNWYISALNDPSSWDVLDVASGERKGDDIIAVRSCFGEIRVFGAESIEVFYNSGDADFPFTRRNDIYSNVGLGARFSLAERDSNLFWLDQWGNVRMDSGGFNPVIISTPQIAYQISLYPKFDDAIGFAYTHEGHLFYVLTFPLGDVTWVYDVTTGFWHKRMSFKGVGLKTGASTRAELVSVGLGYGAGGSLSELGRWRPNCYEFFAGKHYIGDCYVELVGYLDHTSCLEFEKQMKAIRTCQVVDTDSRKRISFKSLELLIESGVGLTTGVGDLTQGTDPQIVLTWSDDFGKTWSNQHWASMGKVGEYKKRVKWNRLGMSRNRIFKVEITDPVNRVITGAFLEAS